VDNASRILTTLDSHLDHEVRLILYGRAALMLGYENAPLDIAYSLDVDAILPSVELPKWEKDAAFWKAQQATNDELQASGLFVTHLFVEDQVFLRPCWLEKLVPINRLKLLWLRLFRPSTIDLVLTKMMRGADEQDLRDVEFLIRHDGLTRKDLEAAIDDVRLPEVPELKTAFEEAKPRVLALV
jgi:hypothetical protein